MSSDQFRCLVRGDLVHAIGSGDGVVEAVYYQGGQVKINLQLRRSGEIVEGIPETEAEMIRAFIPKTALRLAEVA